jgi:hypothetical protein
LNTDLSVAPELAQLADPFVPPQHVTAARRTEGRVAGALTELAATPQRWWDLVRFDPAGPVRIPVPGEPGAWLLVLPPGTAVDCDCQQATALAGEATEAPGDQAPGAPPNQTQPNQTQPNQTQPNQTQPNQTQPNQTQPSPLRPGRVRVHGAAGRHRLHAAGPGYSVTLHVGASSSRSG